jgi:hypothetical protein
VSTTIGKILGRTAGASPLQRELLFAGAALLTGLLLMPILVWIAGRMTLGEYTHGGLFALWGDYLRGLASGELAFWIMLLGPYGFLLLGRITARVAR